MARHFLPLHRALIRKRSINPALALASASTMLASEARDGSERQAAAKLIVQGSNASKSSAVSAFGNAMSSCLRYS